MRSNRYIIVAILLIVLVVALLVLAPDLIPSAWHRVKHIPGDLFRMVGDLFGM
jgi:Sec-independent protein translocase protein TatA